MCTEKIYIIQFVKGQALSRVKGSKTFTLLEALKLQDIGFEIKFKPIELLEDV